MNPKVDKIEEKIEFDDDLLCEVNLIDYETEDEPNISSLSSLGQDHAPISENQWNQYPFKPVCQQQWDQQISEIMSQIAEDNPYRNILIGDEISASEFINWIKGSYGQDCRPKLYDNITKSYILWDTGAMTCCIPKSAGDKINKKVRLRTADGKPMNTYGTKEFSIRLGRKTYTIEAIVTDVKQPIIGMDLIAKYKLGFEWLLDDLYVIDKKAGIRQKLKFVTIANNSLPTTAAQLIEVQNDLEKIETKPKIVIDQKSKKLLKMVPEKYRKHDFYHF